MEDGTDTESDQEASLRTEAPSATREVNMTKEVVVDRLVPFAPILAEIASIPPITVEASVRELAQLRQEV